MQRIQSAIETTKNVLGDYWSNTVAQRLPGGAGSIVSGIDTPEAMEKALQSAEWVPYQHPSLMAGTEAFLTYEIQGREGILNLDSLPLEAVVTLDDRKDTGKVSAVVEGQLGPQVNYVVLIIGQHEGNEVVFTFHPGAPVQPSKVEAVVGLHGKKVSVAQAIEMGLTTAKVA